jgi:ATP-binding cassette, subfamily B, bacterial HlyB/CyaB
MSYTVAEFQEFLLSVAPFDKLPSEALAELAQKIEPWRYRMGQIVVTKDKMLPHVAILYEGKARLLGYDPRTPDTPITLKLLESGALVGWVNMIRGLACETVISSTEAVCLTIKNNEMMGLISQYPQFSEAFYQQAAILEVFDLLGTQLERQALGEVKLKELTMEIMEDVAVQHLPPGTSYVKDSEFLRDSQRTWLVSGGSIVNFPVGSRIEPTAVENLEVIGVMPARLIGIPTELLATNNAAKIRNSLRRSRIARGGNTSRRTDSGQGYKRK